jgi:glycerol uptake facilitator-like aquaporin
VAAHLRRNLGRVLIVVVAAGGEVVAARSGGAVTPGMRAVAPGLMVMAIIYFMGAVSGPHLNSAVTLAFAVRWNFPWRRAPGYVLGQVVGGILAALFLRIMFSTIAALGATVPQWHRQRKSDNRVGEHNPRQGLRSTQHRHQRCNRGRRIYRLGRTLGSANQWRPR